MSQTRLFVRPHYRRDGKLVSGYTRYYSSGANHPGEILGHDDAKHPVGVSARELTPKAIDALERVRVPVFVDSGAFGEIDKAGKVVRPLGPADWEHVFGVYERLSRAGVDLTVVAPDRVGDQAHTLRLLELHGPRVRALMARGVRVLVPLQRGGLTLTQFADKVSSILGAGWTPGIPSSKLAAPLNEVVEVLRGGRFASVHLLGRGPKRKSTDAVLETIHSASPGIEVTMDSNFMLANLGAGRVGTQEAAMARGTAASTEQLKREQVRYTIARRTVYETATGHKGPPQFVRPTAEVTAEHLAGAGLEAMALHTMAGPVTVYALPEHRKRMESGSRPVETSLRLLVKAVPYKDPFEPCTCTEGCTEHAMVHLFDSETGDAFRTRVPYAHRYDSVGWHGRSTGSWTAQDGTELHGLEVSRGSRGTTFVDAQGRTHRVEHGQYKNRTAPADELLGEKVPLRKSEQGYSIHHEVVDRSAHRSDSSERQAVPRQGGAPDPNWLPALDWQAGSLWLRRLVVRASGRRVESAPSGMGNGERPSGPGAGHQTQMRHTRMRGADALGAWHPGGQLHGHESSGSSKCGPGGAAPESEDHGIRCSGDQGTQSRRRNVRSAGAGVWTGSRSDQPDLHPEGLETRLLTKAKSAPLKAGQRWITVHGNGEDSKGVPILIEQNKDGSHSVVAGAGGKLSHLKLKGIKSPEEYAEQSKAKADERKTKERERKSSQTKDEAETEKKTKADLGADKLMAERQFIERVRGRMGGVDDDIHEEKLKALSPGGRNTVMSRHHRKQLTQAHARVEEASRKLVEEGVERHKQRQEAEKSFEETDPVVHQEVMAMASEELGLRAQEATERQRDRELRKQRVTGGDTGVGGKAAEAAKEIIAKVEDPAPKLAQLGGRDDDPDQPVLKLDLKPSEEIERRTLQKQADAKILAKVAETGKPENALEARVVQKALKAAGGDGEELDDAAKRDILAKEAARSIRSAEVLKSRAEHFKSVESNKDAGGLDAAIRQLAFTDLTTNIARDAETAKRLGLTETDKTPLKEAEIEAFRDVLGDAEKLRRATKEFRTMTKAAETKDYEKARGAIAINVGKDIGQDVETTIEDEIRRQFAEQVRGLADRQRTDFTQTHAAGSYDVLADVGLGIGGHRYIDRPTLDALGPQNAAVLLRHSLEEDGHFRAKVLRALETHHVDTLNKVAGDAIEKAEGYVPGLSATVGHVGDIETALGQVDAHRADIAEAQKAVGSALGRLETTALLAQTFRQKQPEDLTVHGQDMNTTLQWLHSVGLTNPASDYSVDYAGKTVTIPKSAWGKLVNKLPPEEMAKRRDAMAIKSGKADEKGWLPAGIVRREASTFTASTPAAPRSFEPLNLKGGGANMREAMENHLASRLADGEQPHDVLHDMLAPTTMASLSPEDTDAYTGHIKELFPLTDAEGRRRKYEDSADHFNKLVVDWAVRKANTALTTGGAEDAFKAFHSSIQGQDLQVADPGTHEALFRTMAEYPHTATAFTPTGQLKPDQRRAIRDQFYQRMGINPDVKAKEAQFRAELEKLGPEPDPNKGTMSMFGGGGPSPEYRDWERSRDALLSKYPREGLQEGLKAAKGDPAKEAAARQRATEAKTAWDSFVETHGSLELAQRAIQDEMKHEAVQRFREHYGKVTGRPLKTGVAEVTNRERHVVATATPEEAEKIKAEQQAMSAKLRERVGGKFASEGEGAVREKYTKFLEQETIDKQNQLGMFGGAQSSMFGGPAATATPEAPKLKEPGKGERYTLGARAEGQIASLMPKVAEQFETGKGVKLFAGLDMDQGDRIHQQRAIKMLARTGRMGGYLGPGSGKSLISIGAFTHLHDQGKASHGLYLVPSAVQDQFGGEMLRFTEPGKYRWDTGSGKDHAGREAMLANPDLHMKVLTHEGFSQTVAQMMADHHTGGDVDKLKDKLRTSSTKDRATMLRQVREAKGIKPWFFYGDEAHKFTTRGGSDPSLTHLVMSAASHPDNATHALFGTGTPHKNDESEVHSMASMIDPDRYGDRHEFMQSFGTELGQRPDAIRRELAHATYSASVLPEGIERTDTDNPRIENGRKVAGDAPIKLEGQHKADVDRVTGLYTKAKRARDRGDVDVEAIKGLSPKRFEGRPEEEHEAIARSLAPSLGIVRESAMRRAINQAPEAHNQKLKQLADVVHHDVHAGQWTDKFGRAHTGKPSIIFTDSAQEAEMLHEHLKSRGLRSAFYHGGLDAKQRESVRLGFQPERGEPKHDVVVCTSAAEAGINMQRAKVIHHFDVPQTEKSHAQRSGRAYRQGQEGDVEIHNWHTDADYEQNALRRLKRKEGLAAVFQAPIGNLDETGIAAAYHAAQADQHQDTLDEAV